MKAVFIRNAKERGRIVWIKIKVVGCGGKSYERMRDEDEK